MRAAVIDAQMQNVTRAQMRRCNTSAGLHQERDSHPLIPCGEKLYNNSNVILGIKEIELFKFKKNV